MRDILPRIEADIAYPGWTVMGVGDEKIVFTYTIGLWHNYQHPELIIVGLPIPLGLQLLNWAGTTIREENQVYSPEIPYLGLVENYPVIFKSVAKVHYDEFFGTAIRFYGHDNFPALQYFWVDKKGKFPWQSSDMSFRIRQRDLSLTDRYI